MDLSICLSSTLSEQRDDADAECTICTDWLTNDNTMQALSLNHSQVFHELQQQRLVCMWQLQKYKVFMCMRVCACVWGRLGWSGTLSLSLTFQEIFLLLFYSFSNVSHQTLCAPSATLLFTISDNFPETLGMQYGVQSKRNKQLHAIFLPESKVFTDTETKE